LPDTIVIHHAAAPTTTTVAQIRDWHKAKGWRDIGYHWLITDAPDSPLGPQMHMGRPHDFDDSWEPWERGAHVKGHNSHTVGICLVGSHSDYAPSEAALDLLHGWLVALCLNWNLGASDIRGHREMKGAATECPGSFVDMDAIRERVRVALEE
jgi:N-acetyl-anhydromuramyl-L-alanine amidase AmpD